MSNKIKQPDKKLSDTHLLNIGFGNTVVALKIVTILNPNSAPMKRLRDEARKDKHLLDATHGRRTRSIIILDSNHIVLSAIQPETISQRYELLMSSAIHKEHCYSGLLDQTESIGKP